MNGTGARKDKCCRVQTDEHCMPTQAVPCLSVEFLAAFTPLSEQ